MASSLLHTKPRRRTAGKPVFTAAEFFAGIGLVRLALEHQKWRVVFANDIDPQKAEMYRDNFGDDHLVVGDIHKLSPDDVPDCTLFTASFPCNDLSIAGAMEGLHGKESSAFWGFMDIVNGMKERRPPLILLENVLGFLMSQGGGDFEAALLALNRAGYAVDAFVLNAVHFVPQSRARLFVVAKRMNVRAALPNVETSSLRPEALTQFMNAHANIKWDVRALPDPPKPTAKLRHVIESLPDDDPHWWDEERAAYFWDQLSERHKVLATILMEAKTYSYGTAFRRVRHGRSMAELRVDEIAGCLRTPRGGSGRQILFRAAKGRYGVRLLTARECARLQGAPETFKISVPLNQALFGFGDAVCVPAVEWIAKHYLLPVARERVRNGAEQALF